MSRHWDFLGWSRGSNWYSLPWRKYVNTASQRGLAHFSIMAVNLSTAAVAWQEDSTFPQFRPLMASENEPALQFFDQVGAST